MLRQDDNKLQMVKRFGCFFLCCGYIAEDMTGLKLTPEQVYNVLATAVYVGDMKSDLYIRYQDNVINHYLEELGSDKMVIKAGHWNLSDGYEPRIKYDYVIERYRYGNIFHFKMAGYDPHPGLKLGGLTGKRYFRIGG